MVSMNHGEVQLVARLHVRNKFWIRMFDHNKILRSVTGVPIELSSSGRYSEGKRGRMIRSLNIC